MRGGDEEKGARALDSSSRRQSRAVSSDLEVFWDAPFNRSELRDVRDSGSALRDGTTRGRLRTDSARTMRAVSSDLRALWGALADHIGVPDVRDVGGALERGSDEGGGVRARPRVVSAVPPPLPHLRDECVGLEWLWGHSELLAWARGASVFSRSQGPRQPDIEFQRTFPSCGSVFKAEDMTCT
jgi:hypothetical protein